MTWQITRFPELSVESKKEISDFIQANYKERDQAKSDTYTYGPQAAFGDVSAAYWYSKALSTIDRQDKALNLLLTSSIIWSDGLQENKIVYSQYIAEFLNLSSFKKTGQGTLNNDTDLLGSKWANYTLKYLSGDDTISVSNGGHRVFVNLGSGNDSFQGNSGSDGAFGDIGDDTIKGGDGFDVLDGGDENDMISGESDKDLLHGGLGDDILSGGAGDDFIDGGEGNDTATYQGNFNDYQITFDNSLLKIIDSTSTRDGSDTLARIEYLQFNDVKKTVLLLAGAPKEAPTYTLIPSTTTINEGSTLTTSVATTNVASGTTLHYSLSGAGITAADFSAGALIGSGAVGDDGKVLISHTLENDLTTEGIETLSIKLFSDTTRTIQVGSTVSVTITDTSVALTYYNPSTNNTLNTWTAYQVTNSVKAGDIVSQWFGTASAATQQIQDISYTKLMDVVATTWADKVQINRVVKASDAGGKIEAKQIDFTAGEVAGSVISGDIGNDDIKGYAGWDFLDGGAGADLIHGGNGRDIISGGVGRDELHGDFGWNTYRSEKDGVSDLIAIKSDHYLVNWLYGKAGNSPNGEKSDIIEGLDSIDKIKLIGIDTREITFAANVNAKGVTGIGIYGKGILEALYTGGDLTVAQITQMTSGDASTAAMSNSINAYGVW
ncbi:hypothetical protein AAF134_00940 [Synechococcus lacustris Tous-12m]